MNAARTSKVRNSLFLKGVLIVLLPCIVNSTFIFSINKFWQKTAQAALSTEQQLKTMLTLNDAFDSFLTFGYDVLSNTFRETRASRHGLEFVDAHRVVNEKLDTLPPEANALLHKFGDITTDLDNLLESVDKEKLHDSRSRFNTFAHILKKACTSGSELDSMLRERTIASVVSASADKKLAADAFALFLIAVSVEIVLGLILFAVFIRTIVRRLRILANNAALLDQWSELPDLGGTDELSFLDSVFKDAGARLKAVAKISEEQKELLGRTIKNLTENVSAYFVENEKAKTTFAPEQRKVFDQWMQSAQSALDRLQVSSVALVPDRRSRNIQTAKKSEIDFSEVDVFALVESCFRELAPLALIKEVDLVNNCEAKPIQARREKLTLVMMKYFVNALKNAPAATKIFVTQDRRDNWINISVKDAGDTVSASAQKQIFNDGTNGLYLCKTILENEGGKFGAKASGNKGNEFWFSLPAVPPKPKSTFSINELMGVGGDSRYRQQKYIFQSGLFRKAALIVFTPMAMHLLLFMWMGHQLNALQQMIDKGHKEEALTFTVSSLWLNSFLANSAAAIFLTTRDKTYYTSAMEHVNHVDESIRALKISGDLSESELSLIRDTSDFGTKQSKLVRQGMADSSAESVNATLKIMPSMFNRSAQLSDQLNHLMGVESHKTHEATRQQVELQGFMEKLIYAAIFCNFLLALFCLRFFVVSFNNRINGLVVEAEMVVQGQSLPISTDWNDEVDQIQGLLALASKNIEVASQSEAAAKILLALEISSPLETLDSLFRIIESVPELQNDSSHQLLASVRPLLESAFDQIDRLLVPAN